jgi:DNA-binding NtrC family response regulator
MGYQEAAKRKMANKHLGNNAAERPSIHKSKATILVVDDEPDVLKTIREILVVKGFDVVVAADGIQAVDAVASTQNLDLIITDMNMPGMNGLDLLKLIGRLKRNLPIIILTGNATLENALESVKEGAWNYLFKPFSVEKLLSAVVRALSQSRPQSDMRS